MKIAFFSGDITRSGGTERVATTVAQVLSKMDMYHVLFVSLTEAAEKPFYPLDNSINRTFLSNKWINPGPGYFLIILKLIKYIRNNQIDVLIDIDGVLDVLSIPAKLFTGVGVVSWAHFNFYQDLGSSYRKWIRRLSARYADCIVTLTDDDKRFHKENLHIRHDIRVIHNPIGYMDEVPRTVGKKKDKFIILSAGNLVIEKGFDYIPEIGLILSRQYPQLEWEWSIVGEGNERSAIQAKINMLGLENRILLKGRSNHINEYYRNADIYVMTSRSEGLPMVLLEAKMFHLPIVSFDIHTGPREIIRHGKNGFLLSPPKGNGLKEFTAMAEHIAILAANEDLCNQFAEHSMDHMELFQLDYVADCWNNLLMKLITTK